jgi:hypothetical protein
MLRILIVEVIGRIAVFGKALDQCFRRLCPTHQELPSGKANLADGERVATREHFQACLATRCYGGQAWDWSATALARLKADPAWPRWITRPGQ